jgi:hypothetical protein
VSEVCRRFERVPQVLRSVRLNGSSLEDARVKSAIAKGETRLGRSGRLLIRPSGTEPVIRVMAEGDDMGVVESVVKDIVEALSHAEVRSRGLMFTPGRFRLTPPMGRGKTWRCHSNILPLMARSMGCGTRTPANAAVL